MPLKVKVTDFSFSPITLLKINIESKQLHHYDLCKKPLLLHTCLFYVIYISMGWGGEWIGVEGRGAEGRGGVGGGGEGSRGEGSGGEGIIMFSTVKSVIQLHSLQSPSFHTDDMWSI